MSRKPKVAQRLDERKGRLLHGTNRAAGGTDAQRAAAGGRAFRSLSEVERDRARRAGRVRPSRPGAPRAALRYTETA